MSKLKRYIGICNQCNKEFVVVINEGHDVSNSKIRWTCPHCNTVLKASPEFIDYVNKKEERRLRKLSAPEDV